MASKTHQFILGLVIKQIIKLGYEIKFIDGKIPGPKKTEEIDLIPPRIINHRHDVFGINSFGRVCIGEAKTDNDICKDRTKTQFIDFANLSLNGQLCQVVIGVPESAKIRFRELLKQMGLNFSENIHVLYIPNELINE